MTLETKRKGTVYASNTSMILTLTEELKSLGIYFSDEVDIRTVYREGERIIEIRKIK